MRKSLDEHGILAGLSRSGAGDQSHPDPDTLYLLTRSAGGDCLGSFDHPDELGPGLYGDQGGRDARSFFVAFLPQFLHLEAGPATAQLLLPGALAVAVAIPIELFMICTASRLSERLRHLPGLSRLMGRMPGTVLIFLGARFLSATR